MPALFLGALFGVMTLGYASYRTVIEIRYQQWKRRVERQAAEELRAWWREVYGEE